MIAAVVPAAGRSQRMGRPKMLLPMGGQTLIGRVVTALREGGAEPVVVVAPPEDSDEGHAVAAAASIAGALIVIPRIRPKEMRHSIEIGIETLAGPTPPLHVLLAPGDAAGITRTVVIRLVEESARHPAAIIVPRRGPSRGHPVMLPWAIAAGVSSLPTGQGVNALLAGGTAPVIEVPVADSGIAEDIDTPEDYRRWQEQEPENVASTDRLEPGRAASFKPENRVQVPVMFFALARDRAGCTAIDLELAGGSRVRDLRAELARRLPGLAPLMQNVMIAVNEEYAGDEAYIMPGSRVAVIPPVSGGAGGRSPARWVELRTGGSDSP
jgi:molybdenum cofactor cytidylyltransferase